LSAALLGSCNFPDPEPEPEEVLPCLEGSQLVAPENLSPDGVFVDPSSLVTLSWSYSAVDCYPDRVELYVWTGVEPAPPGMTGWTPWPNTQLQWPIPLEPDTLYFWRAYGGIETGPGSDVQGPSTLAWFYTGELCSPGTAMLAPELVYPPDGADLELPDDGITFLWDDSTSCMVDGSYEFQLSDSAGFGAYSGTVQSTMYAHMPATWFVIEPDSCNFYYWRVISKPDEGDEDLYSETWSFTFNTTDGLECEQPLAGPALPRITSLEHLNCYAGPSPAYPVEDAFLQGMSAMVEGRNEAGTWWWILSPKSEVYCWVRAEHMELEGDASLVPFREAPVLVKPTRKPDAGGGGVNCSQYNTPEACKSNSACSWYKPPAGGDGSCKNK